MIREFEEVSIEINRIPVGRFSGAVEFTIKGSQCDVECIWLNDEECIGQQIKLEPFGTSVKQKSLFSMLEVALRVRFAQDLMRISRRIAERETANARSAVQ